MEVFGDMGSSAVEQVTPVVMFAVTYWKSQMLTLLKSSKHFTMPLKS